MSNTQNQFSNPLDSEVCASIPISFITSIQPHGYLLVLNRQSLEIIQVSQNLLQALNLPVEELLHKPLANFVMAQAVEEIRKNAAQNGSGNHIPTQLFFSTPTRTLSCLAVLHLQNDYLILELEENKLHETAPSFINVYQQIKQILGTLKKIESTDNMLQIAADEIKTLSGFDRVMMYKFDNDWNGTVVAESLEPDMDPYLDLRFPASDIPRQARELYLRTPYRCIPEVGYVPSALLPEINPLSNTFTDLSDCSLRGVPAVHLEYLQNMGVGSSMSTSIIKDNKLWGLISCHHKTTKFVSYELRSAFELLANVISSQLSARENEATMRKKSNMSSMHNRLLELMTEKNDFVAGLTEGSPNILDFLDLTGAILISEGAVHTTGDVPDNSFILELKTWLTNQKIETVFYTDSLPKLFPAAEAFKDCASGALAIPLSGNNNDWLIGLRPEIIRQVSWGGNPNEHLTIEQGNDKIKLHPRNSFQNWKEIVKLTAQPWQEHEIEAALHLKNSILEVILKMQILKRMIAEEEVYKLSIVASKTNNAVLILNKFGDVEWINQAFTNYTGVDLKEAIGRNLKDLTKTSQNLEEIGEIISKSNYNSNSYSKNISLEKDNKRFFINFNFTPISNPQEEYDRCIAIGTDVTHMREHAEQLETINKELDKFAYIIAHDLKAPLRSIESLTDAIAGNLESGDNSDTPELLKYMNRSVKRMSHLITDVLSYSRIGRINIEEEEVNVSEILADVVEWLRPPDNVKITIQDKLPVIKTVKSDLQQIFSNLIGNAIKHSNIEDCCIDICYTKTETEHKFAVVDNGEGIPVDYQEKIFEMFQSGPRASTNVDDTSTGIGLATVKKLVEDRGGKIWVDSSPGQGAAFYFTLPL